MSRIHHPKLVQVVAAVRKIPRAPLRARACRIVGERNSRAFEPYQMGMHEQPNRVTCTSI
jgi:hypothetical protein